MDNPFDPTVVPPPVSEQSPPPPPPGQTPYPPPYQPMYAPPYQPVPPKKMSAGAKWAIGIGIGLVVLTLIACPVIAVLSIGGEDAALTGDSIALIHLDGVIAGTGSIYDGISSPEYIIDQLDQALADDSVKAILIRIDSPGGTVAASQEIAMAVREASAIKPVVASIGDMGASGAYMVASQCDEIVAAPGSSVGSIGVIMEIPNLDGLLDKLGVEFTVLHEGELKDVGSPYRSVTPTESAMLQAQMAIAYDQFITDVAVGRGMDEAEVRELATGWVWLGSEAIDLGLVDRLGNYSDAVDVAAELGGIEGAPNIVSFEYEDPFSALYNLFSLQSSLEPDSEALRRLGLPR